MANSTPPDQRPPHLRDDEPIALLVAFLAFGAIGWWSFNEYQNGRFNLAFLQPSSSTSPVAKVTALPTPALPPFPQASQKQEENKVARNPINHSAQPPSDLSPKPVETRTSQTNGVKSGPISALGRNRNLDAALQTSASAPTHSSAIATAAPGFFTDVPETHWAYASIKALAALNLAEGFPNNTYQPEAPISRSAYAALIEKAFEKPEQSTAKVFKDVKAGNPQSQIVSKIVKSNFMTGYPDSTFKPDQTISRTEAMAALVKGLGLRPPANPDTVLQRYQDYQSIPSWAKPKVAAAVASGLLVAYPNSNQLNPQALATRADAAALVVKGLEVGKK